MSCIVINQRFIPFRDGDEPVKDTLFQETTLQHLSLDDWSDDDADVDFFGVSGAQGGYGDTWLLTLNLDEVAVAWLEIVRRPAEGSMHITNLLTCSLHRGQGFASVLLTLALQFTKRSGQIRLVTVDDFSSLYRQPGNIYHKFGFTYQRENEPEMELLLF
jgi:GNAT superfamily N-acetyltransferase